MATRLSYIFSFDAGGRCVAATLAWFLVFCVLAGTLPIERENYYSLPDAKFSWIKSRLFAEPCASVVFLGSSHTWTGIDPAIIEAGNSNCGKVWNFGTSWQGRNLHCVFARDILDRQPIRDIVFEIGSTEPVLSHRWFSRICRSGDVFTVATAFVFVNECFKVPEVINRNNQSFEVLHSLLVRPGAVVLRQFIPPVYDGSAMNRTAGWDPKSIGESRVIKEEVAPLKVYSLLAREKLMMKLYPRGRVAELYAFSEIARPRGVRLHFLFLPKRGAPLPDSGFVSLLEEMGDVWIPDCSELYRAEYWHDPEHLNSNGAEVLSRWVAGKLVESISKH